MQALDNISFRHIHLVIIVEYDEILNVNDLLFQLKK